MISLKHQVNKMLDILRGLKNFQLYFVLLNVVT